MDILIILFIIFAIVSNVQKRKKQAEEAQRRKQAAQSMQDAAPKAPAPPVMRTAGPVRRDDPRFPVFEFDEEPGNRQPAPNPREQQRKAEQRRQTMEQARRDAQAAQRRNAPMTPSSEGKTHSPLVSTVTNTMSYRMEEAQGRQHTLEASSLTGHAHMETSITGVSGACPPEPLKPATAAVAAEKPMGFQVGNLSLAFDQPAVVTGLLYAEILGKPKALRR